MPKISALPSISTIENGDPMPIVDDSATTTKKLTVNDLKALFSPVGTVYDYAGAAAPTGWLLCYGQAVSRTTYADLYAVIGTTYGVGDGSTTFNIPDLRGRVIAGQDDMGGTSANRLTGLSGGIDGDVLGGTGGAQSHTLLTAEMPSHTHTQDAHSHQEQVATAGGAGTGITGTANLIGNTGSNQTTVATTATNQNTGGGGAHNNVQPTLILNKIIRY